MVAAFLLLRFMPDAKQAKLVLSRNASRLSHCILLPTVVVCRARDDQGTCVRRRKNDLSPPDKLTWGVAVGDQSLKLNTVGGAKVKADVITSHTTNIARQTDLGNPTSGVEH